MADEKEKIEIEDIKDPEDLDIDAVVKEDESAEIEPEDLPKEKAEPKNDESDIRDNEKAVLEKNTDKPEDIEEAKEEENLKKPTKPLKLRAVPSHKKKPFKIVALVIVALALLAAAVLGVLYYLDQKNKPVETADTTQTEVTPDETTTVPETVPTEKTLYVNSDVGLNLREKPNPTAKVLAIIPFGYKITVLEEQGDWVKTTYSGKTGWVSATYTQATNPLVYENETYGFGLTFKGSWAGYKFFKANNAGSTTEVTYYVALPTNDKNWNETASGITKGYASLFVMGVYTKAEWAKLAGGEMLPAKLGEGDKYVYTYLPGQAYATDLKTQFYEINEIIKTFEVLK